MHRLEKTEIKNQLITEIKNGRGNDLIREVSKKYNLDTDVVRSLLIASLDKSFTSAEVANICGRSMPWVTTKARIDGFGEEHTHYGRQVKYMFDVFDVAEMMSLKKRSSKNGEPFNE